MKAEELNRMYRKQAEALETEGKVKEAERLYLMINEPEIAINMYKKARMYADVVRLVRTHKPDELEATNLAFARVRPARTRPPNRTRTRTRNGNKVLYSTSTRIQVPVHSHIIPASNLPHVHALILILELL